MNNFKRITEVSPQSNLRHFERYTGGLNIFKRWIKEKNNSRFCIIMNDDIVIDNVLDSIHEVLGREIRTSRRDLSSTELKLKRNNTLIVCTKYYDFRGMLYDGILIDNNIYRSSGIDMNGGLRDFTENVEFALNHNCKFVMFE